MWNIHEALKKYDAPIVYVRFNPHYFFKDDTLHDMPLSAAHELLLRTINNITKLKHEKGMNLVYVNYDTADNKLCFHQIV